MDKALFVPDRRVKPRAHTPRAFKSYGAYSGEPPHFSDDNAGEGVREARRRNRDMDEPQEGEDEEPGDER